MRQSLKFSALLGLLIFMFGCGGAGNTNTAGNANSANVTTGATNANANRGTTASALSEHDRQFFTEAAHGGMAEVEMGRLATERASNPAVKQFGQRMVDDHTRANNELKQLAARKGVTLPTALDSEQRDKLDRLSKLSGAAFDREYMKEMVADHDKDVEEFQKESERATDPDVKAFASKTLPMLQQHLELAGETNKKVNP
jgi:putative membrane protein